MPKLRFSRNLRKFQVVGQCLYQGNVDHALSRSTFIGNLTFMWPLKFLIIKPNRCTNFSRFLFWNETLHVLDSSSVHHQEFPTVHTAIVYVVQVFWQLASRISMEREQFYSDPVSKPLRHIPLLCVQWKIPDNGQRNCMKHVQFHFKTKILIN